MNVPLSISISCPPYFGILVNQFQPGAEYAHHITSLPLPGFSDLSTALIQYSWTAKYTAAENKTIKGKPMAQVKNLSAPCDVHNYHSFELFKRM